MYPTYNNYSKGQHVPPFQHHQTGQPLFRIGTYASYPVTVVNHMPTNMFMNQPHLHRTFASVVCENPNFDPATTQVMDASMENNGFFKTVLNCLTKQPPILQPQSYQQQHYSNKEFEDFTKMPTINQNSTYGSSNFSPPPNYQHYQGPQFEKGNKSFINHQQPYYHQQPPPTQKHHNNSHRPRNFFNSFMGNFYPSQPQQQQQPPPPQKPNNNNNGNQRWFSKSFRCNRNNNNNNKYRHHSRFHHHDATNPKNVHEKERTSIERDIKNDFCDIRKANSKLRSTETANNKTTTTTKTEKCDNKPFELFSLEEFPAIVPSCSSTDHVIEENGFVSYKDDAAATTPTYTPIWPPKRISLCETMTKIVKSPQKLLTLATPKRSCLKPTPLKSRTTSECSDDDYVVFSNGDGDSEEESNIEEEEELDDDSDSDSSDDSESEMSDDDTLIEDEELDEVDDAGRIEELTQKSENQPDSGIDGGYEDKKVHFALTPTVHVMRAWDYAYRQARQGSCWRQAAVDRERFKNRILAVEGTLKAILHPTHRDNVYHERFQEAQEMK